MGREGLEVVAPGSPVVIFVAIEGLFGGEDWVAVVLGWSEPVEKAEVFAVELKLSVAVGRACVETGWGGMGDDWGAKDEFEP